MNDLEITKLCALAMDLRAESLLEDDPWPLYLPDETDAPNYDPLHDDAQAMALVKRFRLGINSSNSEYFQVWPQGRAISNDEAWVSNIFNADLSRAICLCVAALQSSKPEG